MCSCGWCRAAFRGPILAGAVLVFHKEPHVDDPIPGALAQSFGKVAVVSASTSSRAVLTGTGEAVWTGFAPTVTVSRTT